MSLFSFKNSRVKPRQFTYIPQYYDQEKDQEENNKFDFKGSATSYKYKIKRSQRSPVFYFALIILIMLMIYLLKPSEPNLKNQDELELSTEDVPVLIEEVK